MWPPWGVTLPDQIPFRINQHRHRADSDAVQRHRDKRTPKTQQLAEVLSYVRLKSPVLGVFVTGSRTVPACGVKNSCPEKMPFEQLKAALNVLSICYMATILIRDVPEEVHAELVTLAGRNRRSKEKQALFLIEGGLRRRKTPAEVLTEAKRIHAQFKETFPMEEVLKATEEAH